MMKEIQHKKTKRVNMEIKRKIDKNILQTILIK